MDFSPLTDVLASKSYDKVADVCDSLMLQVMFRLSHSIIIYVFSSTLKFENFDIVSCDFGSEFYMHLRFFMHMDMYRLQHRAFPIKKNGRMRFTF